jgi:hypothetical protein
VEDTVVAPAEDPRLVGRGVIAPGGKGAVFEYAKINQKSQIQPVHGLPSGNSSGQLHPIVANEDWAGKYPALSENMTADATEPVVQESQVDAPQDPRLPGRSTTTTGNKDAVSPAVSATLQSQRQTADYSTTGDFGMPSHVLLSARFLLPSETWKPMFSGSYGNAPSLGAPVSSPVNEGASLASHNESNSVTPISGKKRAASLPIERESAKKTKLNSTEGVVVDKGLTSLDDDIEQRQAKYVQAKQRLAAPPGMDVDISNPKSIARPASADAAVQAKEHERRDSAVATAAFFNPPPATLDGRQPTCMHCRFAILECNHQSPCQHCEAQMNACVYWKCEFEEQCTAPNCWYSHEPASEDIEELLPGMPAESRS